jgi:hypothetical protein
MGSSPSSRLTLDWVIENNSVPLEVTNTLQEIADKYQYPADLMHLHKLQVVEELYQAHKGYITAYLFPNGLEDNERWLHALIRMEIRRLQQISNMEEEGDKKWLYNYK